MIRFTSIVAVGAALLAGVAQGGPIFLITDDAVLYRTDGLTVESFLLSDEITAMATGPDGTIWATSQTDDDQDGNYELYRLMDPMGSNPTLQLWGDFLEGLTPTITFIGDTMYGHQKRPGQPLDEGQLVSIDTTRSAQNTVGATGLVGIPTCGSGYDPATDTLYAVAGRPDADLYTVDYGLGGGGDPSATLVGSLGQQMRKHSGEFFDGTLYAGLEYYTGELAIGSIDTATAQYTQMMIVTPHHTGGSIGLAVVPEPTSLALLGLGGLAVLRRRR